MLSRLLNSNLIQKLILSGKRGIIHCNSYLRNSDQKNRLKMDTGNPNDTLIWVDCEMSGLNYDEDVLLEVAIILTDGQLNEVDSLPPMAIKTDEYILSSMNEWCIQNHGKSGLTKACLESDITIEMVDDILYDLLRKRNVEKGILSGNSIAIDRIFLEKWCPKFCSRLHYRMLDVTTVKELIKRWYPSESPFLKQLSHRALDDIRESIDELKFYKSKYFVDPSQFASK